MTTPKSHADKSSAPPPSLTRRSVVKGLGVVAGLPVATALGCADGVTAPPLDGGLATGDDGGRDIDAGAAFDGGPGPSDAGAVVDASQPDGGANEGWTTGGTAAMTDAATYPNPFTSGRAQADCILLCGLTLGPCYGLSAPVRQDISEGDEGIPVRLMLRIVEADGCTPIAGAEAEVWYCDTEGRYSGRDVAAAGFCTGNDAFAEAANFARGRAISDADGTLTFDGTYPGWYPGRAIHIHVLVRRPEFAGGTSGDDTAIISQLLFPEALTEEIFASVDGYLDQGQPDRDFSNDGVLSRIADVDSLVVEYERMTDGAMLAWKTIAISDDEAC